MSWRDRREHRPERRERLRLNLHPGSQKSWEEPTQPDSGSWDGPSSMSNGHHNHHHDVDHHAHDQWDEGGEEWV
jgi:hypothetical protein